MAQSIASVRALSKLTVYMAAVDKFASWNARGVAERDQRSQRERRDPSRGVPTSRHGHQATIAVRIMPSVRMPSLWVLDGVLELGPRTPIT
jgi:hypothetical protein